ncbi:MAG: hypothetical protein QE487_11700 [Fluviicola sp.]|nr:hypothetical protein [Fluviicola sp.]
MNGFWKRSEERMMKETLAVNFNAQFREFKEIFFEKCIQEFDVLNKNFEQRLLLYRVFGNGKDLQLDRDLAINIIESTIFHEQNPEFIHDVIFRLKNTVDLESEDFAIYSKQEEEAFNRFLEKKSDEIKLFHLLAFDCFKEKIVNSVQGDDYLFNGPGWRRFFVDLFAELYPSFRMERSTNEVLFLRDLNENMSFGFRINLKEFNYVLKRYGHPSIPEMQMIIISKNGEKIVSDTNFCHPFFEPLFSLERYILSDYLVKHADNLVEFLATSQKEILPNGRIRLFQSEENGMRYKKYALFKMSLSSGVNNSYFDFLEIVFKQTFK